MPVEKALKILCAGMDEKFDRKVVLALVLALQAKEVKSELAAINTNLHFASLHDFNQFLMALTDFIVNGARHQALAFGPGEERSATPLPGS